jgi:hypothetical protein
MLRHFKISFYVNSHANKLFSGSEKGLTSSSLWVSLCGGTMGDSGGNENNRSSSDALVPWLGRRQNRDSIQW